MSWPVSLQQQLLECDKCRNSYHPECLGPNHPTRPTKKKRVWVNILPVASQHPPHVGKRKAFLRRSSPAHSPPSFFSQVCNKCVRCKCCGATKPGKSWDAQWSHDFSMCHDCAKLFAKREWRARRPPRCSQLCFDSLCFSSRKLLSSL